MTFLNKLERKLGKYAIKNLMKYVIALYIAGIAITIVNPIFYYQWLMLDFDKVASGQVWRIVTFLIQPPGDLDFFLIFTVYLYYMIGNSLEKSWGAFKFNLYFFSGVLFNILSYFIIYQIVGISFPIPLDYINQAMFFAFAALYPNVQLLLMFIIPIKIKFIAFIYAVLFGYNVYKAFEGGLWWYGVAMLVSIANFLIFFAMTRDYRRFSPQEMKRKSKYKKEVRHINNPDNVIQFHGKTVVARHKCAICGKTELDDDSLEFRFCSKCDGNYEYCMEHLYSHEHVHKDEQ